MPSGNTARHHRLRRDVIDTDDKLTFRIGGRLRVIMFIDNLDVRIADAATGELLRELTINPDKDYQPTGKPKRPKKQ